MRWCPTKRGQLCAAERPQALCGVQHPALCWKAARPALCCCRRPGQPRQRPRRSSGRPSRHAQLTHVSPHGVTSAQEAGMATRPCCRHPQRQSSGLGFGRTCSIHPAANARFRAEQSKADFILFELGSSSQRGQVLAGGGETHSLCFWGSSRSWRALLLSGRLPWHAGIAPFNACNDRTTPVKASPHPDGLPRNKASILERGWGPAWPRAPAAARQHPSPSTAQPCPGAAKAISEFASISQQVPTARAKRCSPALPPERS